MLFQRKWPAHMQVTASGSWLHRYISLQRWMYHAKDEILERFWLTVSKCLLSKLNLLIFFFFFILNAEQKSHFLSLSEFLSLSHVGILWVSMGSPLYSLLVLSQVKTLILKCKHLWCNILVIIEIYLVSYIVFNKKVWKHQLIKYLQTIK